jgi:hypothetical protein
VIFPNFAIVFDGAPRRGSRLTRWGLLRRIAAQSREVRAAPEGGNDQRRQFHAARARAALRGAYPAPSAPTHVTGWHRNGAGRAARGARACPRRRSPSYEGRLDRVLGHGSP